MQELQSVSAVIDALGGPSALALRVGLTQQAVSQWRARDSIPADKYLLLQAELKRRGLTAPPSLWGIAEPNEAA
jgi:DNA-binding transcriptional regulator YdaS (Cro superfamily)